MMSDFLCVFDLDGTLYPKKSAITDKMREQIISEIAKINDTSYDIAKEMYFSLPAKYPNPYTGLSTLGITEEVYEKTFLNIDVSLYITIDKELIILFQQLSKNAEIHILSFAPIEYMEKMLIALGVRKYITCIKSVSRSKNHFKGKYYNELYKNGYRKVVVIGDDYVNDLEPAMKYGFDIIHITAQYSIYNAMKKLLCISGEIKVPNTIRIENTSWCNEKCIICPYESLNRKKGKMDFNLFMKIVLEHSSIVENPKMIFPANIGEPFLDNDIFEYISFASKYYKNISVFSNASMLTIEKFKKFVSSGGKELMLTLHGFIESEHKRITKSDTYQSVRENIINISRENYNRNRPVKIYLNIYCDAENVDTAFVDYLVNFGVEVNILEYSKLHNWGGKIQKDTLPRQKECSRIYEQFGVLYNGTVVACCADCEAEYPLGNANELTIQEIFSNEEYKKLVDLERKNELYKNHLCRYCNIGI